MAPIMFASMVVLLLLGYPVAFALAACGLLYGLVGIDLGLFQPSLFQALPIRIFGIMENDTLLAIPFFTFMGLILERSGMAEDLLDTVGQLFGPMPGGLAFAVVFVGALLAATTGVVAASVISMGLISLPIMLRYGYDRRLAVGTIAASGTLAQIIPPSLVLIVLADQLGRSVGDMYAGAIIPGLVLTSLYAGYILGRTLLNPKLAPALPPDAIAFRDDDGGVGYASLAAVVGACILGGMALSHGLDWAPIWSAAFVGLIAYLVALANKYARLGILSRLAQQVVLVMMPPLALIFLVLGTIFIGLATPTEGGAMGATGALLMAMSYRRLTWSLLRQAIDATAKLSAFVIFILVGARVFSLTFYGVNGDLWVEHLLLGLPGGPIGFLIVVNILVFLLAFFLDFFELAFIIIPLLVKPAQALGIDLVWFGVLLGVNMQTSFMHPPFGFALFYLRSVAPDKPYIDKVTGRMTDGVTTAQIYWGAVPYVCIQVVMVALVIAFPGMVTASLDKGPKVDPAKIRIELPPSPDTDDNPPPIFIPPPTK
ncbi:MAG: TRAP transporter large permease subunit [Alphaproteobacteria bacterium]|nr:TRAP transporter large permease subunit [Alphaproteobacteria bacterium]MCW5741212.1 TRAP transporter large permease subunit [Alphaproteobacteria bacterium]